MQIAFLLYEGFTALDWIGPHEAFNTLPDTDCVTVATTPGPVANETGNIEIVATKSLGEVESPEILVVPGGLSTWKFLDDEQLLDWIRNVHETSRWTTSVCTGSLLLAAAGLLDGAPATTHWLTREMLASLGAKPVPDRVVEHGKIITAAGVSSGIDMALHLIQKMYGDETAQASQLVIEYDPEPPVDAGSPEKASEQVTEIARGMLAAQAGVA